MISAWWILPAVLVGAIFGALCAVLCVAGRNGRDNEQY